MFRSTVFAAAASVVVFCSSASAAIVQAVIDGTVAKPYWFEGPMDPGLFGPPDTSLGGAAFRATYVFDTSVGTRTTTATTDMLVGGTRYGAATPIISASITINGATQSVLGDADTFIYMDESIGIYGGYTQFAARDGSVIVGGQSETRRLSMFFYGPSLSVNADLDQPYSLSGLAQLNGQLNSQSYGLFQYQSCSVATGVCGSWLDAYLYPDAVTVSVLDPAPVPLPASALMLLAGLGGMVAARRKRAARG